MLCPWPNWQFYQFTPKSDLVLDAKDPATEKTFLKGVLSAVGDPDQGCNL